MSITIIELPKAEDVIKVAVFALVVIESIRIRKAIKKALKRIRRLTNRALNRCS